MRFAFVSTMYGAPWGASENLWSETARHLAGDGHRVCASVGHWHEPRPALQQLRAGGVETSERASSLEPIWMKVLKKARFPLSPRLSRRGVRRWLQSCRPDLVCVSNGDVIAGTDWLEDCRALGLPYVNLAHGNSEQYWPDDRLGARVREVFASARRCFFVSEGNRSLFEKQIAQRLVNAEIVRSPCNVGWDTACAWPADSPEIHLAVVGKLAPTVKGQDLLIEVMARPEWRERPVFVSIYGQGEWADNISRLTRMFGVSDRVQVRGYVDDVRSIWAGHHALVVPSRAEGLPLVVIEAMMCGRPVIATDVAGNREMVEDGVTGFIAEAPTAPLLAAAMERAWNRRSEWPTIGQEAARQVRERVPRNPVALFAERLLAIAGEGAGHG